MNMKIGFGKTKITPPEGVELGGYGYFIKRRNVGVVEDLFARAIALDVDGSKALLFNADLIGMTHELSEALESAVEKKYGIPHDAIMIASIHTHTGPATGLLCGCGEFDAAFYQSLSQKFMAAVDAAFADMKPVSRVSTQIGTLEKSFAHNRAIPGGEIDDNVRTVYFERENARPVALVNYSCHPVSYSAANKVSSDYCGILCRLLAEDGIDAIYLNGFCGDINPWERDTDPVNCAPHSAAQLFDLVKPMFASGKETEISDVAACGDFLPLELLPITIDEIEGEYDTMLASGNVNEARAGSIWSYTQKGRVARGTADFDPMQYKALRLGKILLVYFSAETAIAFGKFLQKSFPDYLVLFVGNAFATSRYLPTEELVKLHKYEGYTSSFAYNSMPVAHNSGEHCFEKLVDQVRKIV